jgi:hypothetical protein
MDVFRLSSIFDPSSSFALKTIYLGSSTFLGARVIAIRMCLDSLSFSIAVMKGFHLITLSTSKSMAQYSPDHMKWMRLIRVPQGAQKEPNLTEKLFNELHEKPDEPDPTDRHSANDRAIEQISDTTPDSIGLEFVCPI